MNDPWDADKTRENFASRSNLKELETCFLVLPRFPFSRTFNSIVNRGFFRRSRFVARYIVFVYAYDFLLSRGERDLN